MSNYAGSYKFKKASIISNKNKSDISDLISEINVFAYIEQPSATIMVSIKDSVNFLNDYPVKGGQEIEIDVEFGDEIRTWSVVIASIENINSDLKVVVYNLRCVSKLLFKSHFTNISQSFSGKLSDISKTIIDNYKHENEKNNA